VHSSGKNNNETVILNQGFVTAIIMKLIAVYQTIFTEILDSASFLVSNNIL